MSIYIYIYCIINLHWGFSNVAALAFGFPARFSMDKHKVFITLANLLMEKQIRSVHLASRSTLTARIHPTWPPGSTLPGVQIHLDRQDPPYLAAQIDLDRPDPPYLTARIHLDRPDPPYLVIKIVLETCGLDHLHDQIRLTVQIHITSVHVYAQVYTSI